MPLKHSAPFLFEGEGRFFYFYELLGIAVRPLSERSNRLSPMSRLFFYLADYQSLAALFDFEHLPFAPFEFAHQLLWDIKVVAAAVVFEDFSLHIFMINQ